MTITLDAATVTNNGSSVTSLTFSHTVTASQSNLILIVFAAMGNSSTPKSVTGVTYGGVAMTLLKDGTQSLEYNSAWYLLNPPTGANNVVITGSEADYINGGAASFYGVDQTTGVHNATVATGNSTTPSVTVTSATGELVVDGFLFGYSETISAGASQTILYNQKLSTANRTIGASTQAGASSVTNSWTASAAHNWVDIGFSLIPASSSPLALGAATAGGASLAAASLILLALVTGTATGVGNAQASLSQSLVFGGAATGASLAAASLYQSQALSGSAFAPSAASGTLLNTIQLGGTLSGIANASAVLAQSAALAGTALAPASGAASLSQALNFAGSALAPSAVSASLAQSLTLGGSLSGLSAASAGLTQQIGLGANASGTALGAGNLSQMLPFAGGIFGQSAANGAIAQGLRLAGTSLSGASAQGALLQYAFVGGRAIGASAGIGILWRPVLITGSAVGVSSFYGTLGVAPSAALVPDGRFYAALPARNFYGAVAARPYYVPLMTRYFYIQRSFRPFYAALAARSFFALCRPHMTPSFDTKDPAEKVVLTFDATADLMSGETLTTITSTTVTVYSGPNTDASALSVTPAINTAALTINGNAIAIGHSVQATVSGGLDGYQYLITILCATSNANKILALKAILPVSKL